MASRVSFCWGVRSGVRAAQSRGSRFSLSMWPRAFQRAWRQATSFSTSSGEKPRSSMALSSFSICSGMGDLLLFVIDDRCSFFFARIWPNNGIHYGHYNSHNRSCKGGMRVIHYEGLWKTMREKHCTTYTLGEKYHIGHATVQRLQRNEPVSTYTLDRLCKILNCRLEEIAEYIPDEN